MSTQEAANGFVSGELLLRSDENDDRCLPPALEKRLRDSLRGRVARKRCGRSLRRAAILREAAAERRGATVASIAAAKTRGEGLVEEGRAAARRAARAQTRREQRDEEDADARLATLAVRYGSVVAAERRAAQCRERVAEAERLRAIDVLELRNRLAAFALHCDHETRGAARLRRLTPRDAQYARCRRAAAENARRGFFAGGGPFAGLDVVDVFKIENRCLLDAFQREVERRKTPRSDEKKKAVKGLFCDVPAAGVERLVLYGLRGDAAPLERTLFDDAWLADQSRTPGAPTAASPGGFGGTVERKPTEVKARRAARDAASLEFPRAFSRYSTLESVRGDARRGGDQAGRLRVLALCRVLVGAVRVEEDASAEGPEPDALYSSVREEYRPLKPENVLPEFLLLYRLAPAKDKTHVDAPALSGGAALALDGVARQAAGLFAEDGPPAAGDDAAFPRCEHKAPLALAAALTEAPKQPSPRRPRAGALADPPGGEPPRPAAADPVAAHWDLVQRNALHEKRRIVAEIEKVLSSAGEAAASPPRPPSRPSRPADAAWADEPSSPAEKRGRAVSPPWPAPPQQGRPRSPRARPR